MYQIKTKVFDKNTNKQVTEEICTLEALDFIDAIQKYENHMKEIPNRTYEIIKIENVGNMIFSMGFVKD